MSHVSAPRLTGRGGPAPDGTGPLGQTPGGTGLSMDYEVFLLSRIREHYDAPGDNAASVARGLASAARVITAAAAITVVVFRGPAYGFRWRATRPGPGGAMLVVNGKGAVADGLEARAPREAASVPGRSARRRKDLRPAG